MISQNTQDSIKQSLFTTAMANPTMNVKPMAGISARPGAGARNITMAMAPNKPQLSGNFAGSQLKSINTASTV